VFGIAISWKLKQRQKYRITAIFIFPLFQWELWRLISPVREGAHFFFGERGESGSAL